jgi:hypothetical protein
MITSGSGKIYGLIDCNRKVAGDEYNRQTEGKPQTPLSPPFMGLYSLKTVCIITLDNQKDATGLMFIIKLSVSTRPQPTHPGMYPIYYQITTPSKPTQPVLAPPITDTRTP